MRPGCSPRRRSLRVFLPRGPSFDPAVLSDFRHAIGSPRGRLWRLCAAETRHVRCSRFRYRGLTQQGNRGRRDEQGNPTVPGAQLGIAFLLPRLRKLFRLAQHSSFAASSPARPFGCAQPPVEMAASLLARSHDLLPTHRNAAELAAPRCFAAGGAGGCSAGQPANSAAGCPWCQLV